MIHGLQDTAKEKAGSQRREKNKLVMTLLVRDEKDIIQKNIEFHLSKGVDFIIATDNGSIDGTRDILLEYQKRGVLELIDEEEQNYAQAEWVNRMGKIAYEKYGADIIFHCDADEFWLPKSGNLKEEIMNSNCDIQAVKVLNVLLEDRNGKESFPQDAKYLVKKPQKTSDLFNDSLRTNLYLLKYPPKVLFRTDNCFW